MDKECNCEDVEELASTKESQGEFESLTKCLSCGELYFESYLFLDGKILKNKFRYRYTGCLSEKILAEEVKK